MRSKWLISIFIIVCFIHFTLVGQQAYDPALEVTALVHVISYQPTGHHIESGDVTLKVDEVYSGTLRDSVIRFPVLNDKYLIDKFFGQKADSVTILAGKERFVVKYTYYQEEMMPEATYHLIWASTRERRASLEKLESLLVPFVVEKKGSTIPIVMSSPINLMKNEAFGRLFFTDNDTNLVYLETYPGSADWILATPDEGYTHSRKMSDELLKTEEGGRIFYEEGGHTKIAHRQHPASDYWFMATPYKRLPSKDEE